MRSVRIIHHATPKQGRQFIKAGSIAPFTPSSSDGRAGKKKKTWFRKLKGKNKEEKNLVYQGYRRNNCLKKDFETAHGKPVLKHKKQEWFGNDSIKHYGSIKLSIAGKHTKKKPPRKKIPSLHKEL